MEENSLENIGCASADKEKCNCAACEDISLGVLGREGEEGTTAELGEGGVLESRESEEREGEEEEDGELDGELSGTGEDGSERHDKEGDSMSNEGDEGGWNPSDDLPRPPRFTLARLFWNHI